MAQKKSAPTDEELRAMFEGIGTDDDPKNNISAQATDTSASAAPEVNPPRETPAGSNDADDDPLAELRDNLAAPPRPSSRASTPHISSSATSVRKNTPPSSRSGRSSEEKSTTTAEEQKTSRSTPAPQQPLGKTTQEDAGGGGGWWGGWGGLTSMATAAVKQAREAVEDIQKNEDALKLAEQVKGNYGALRGLGDDLRSRALPTFTTLLHTLAPPISQHERLQIHVTQALTNYPPLDPLIYQTFSRVMSQVEGGDLLVLQRDSARPYHGGTNALASGWSDGPWWRQNDANRRLGAVTGLPQGTRTVRASAETFASDFYSTRGGLEEAAKQATAVLSDSNPVRSSDIFLAIQPVRHTVDKGLFALDEESSARNEEGENVALDEPNELISFAVYLHDPVHTITFSALSQGFPHKWASWMDAASDSAMHDGSKFVARLPEEIAGIIGAGGVDPREWVAEWMEESLGLAVGIVAQRYVARRMGVGEGGIGRGRRREEAVESIGGEAARAI